MLEKVCVTCSVTFRTKAWRGVVPNECRNCSQKKKAIRYAAEHRAEAVERARAWRENNRERHREYSRHWNIEHRDYVLGRLRGYYVANRERYNAQSRLWKREHPEFGRLDAKKRYLPREDGTFAYSQILRRDPCSYCGSTESGVDHIVPFASGGKNEIANLTSACPTCNLAKGTKSLLTFMLARCVAVEQKLKAVK